MTVERNIAPAPAPAAPVLAAPPVTGRTGFSSFMRAAFDAARAAHVGIDIQHKYCSFPVQSSLELKERKNIERITRRIAAFTAATRAVMPPVWVNHVNDNDADWRVVPGQDRGWRAARVRVAKILHFNPYSEDDFARRDIFGTHARADDTVVSKAHFDGFEDTRLDDVLRARGADTLVLSGLFMDQCVMETALAARRKGYEVVLAANLSVVGSEMKTGAALRKMSDHGVRIATAGAIMTEARPWI